MRRLTTSAAGILLLAAAFLLGLLGLLADLLNASDPPALFGAAIVAGIAAVAIALDEHRQSTVPHASRNEALFGHALIGLAVLIGIVALVLGLGENPDRNLWLVLAVIVDLDGLAVVIDTHRLAVARAGALETRNLTDAILGVLSAAVGLGLGIVGFVTGMVGYTHAPAWLYAGVVLALLSTAFMFDEQTHVIARSSRQRSFQGVASATTKLPAR